MIATVSLDCKNLFTYAENNPVMAKDSSGGVVETVFDVITIGISVVDVCCNPTDPWAWVGLAGDCVDLIPFVTGVGEGVKGLRLLAKVADKTADVADTMHDTAKAADRISDSVRQLDNVSDAAKAAKKSDTCVVDIDLKYKDGWTAAQKAEADAKVQALSNATTVKTPTNRSGTSASSRYKSAYGKTSVPSGYDVDHTIDLQLGGADDILNMNPLDMSVNRSLGVQIKNAIKGYPDGTVFGQFTIH